MAPTGNTAICTTPQSGVKVKINGLHFSLSWDDFERALMSHESLSAIEVIVPGLPISQGTF